MHPILTAIIYTDRKQVNGNQFLKYRGIKNSEATLQRFEKFAAKFPGAQYINYYCKATKQFVKRIYLNQ